MKTRRGHQHHAADAARGGRAARFGHALDRKARRFRLRRRPPRVRPSWELRGRADRDRRTHAPAARDRRDRHSSGATRAIATARSASLAMPSPEMSLVETTACAARPDPQSDIIAFESVWIPRPGHHALRRLAKRRVPQPRRRRPRPRLARPSTSRCASVDSADRSNRSEVAPCFLKAATCWMVIDKQNP